MGHAIQLRAKFRLRENHTPKNRMEGTTMPTINLRDFYPWCNKDEFVEVSDEMLEAMKAADRQQEAYRRRMYRYKAQYSLDCHDGIENAALHHEPSPEQLLMQKEKMEQLCAALNSLTELQGRRVGAYYLEVLNFRQIAEREGAGPGAVAFSVKAGLKKVKGLLD